MEPRDLNVSFPTEVKTALVEDAQETNRSVNDVAVGILADHYGVKFTPTGRPYRGTTTEAGVSILRRVPARVDQKIEADKSRRILGRTKAAVVTAVIAQHYDIVLDDVAVA